MSTASPSERGLRLLSIGTEFNSKDKSAVSQSKDGGGIRGLSPLLMLKEIFFRIQQENELDSPPRPCEIFDLAGGTGTGGYVLIYPSQMRANFILQPYRDNALSSPNVDRRCYCCLYKACGTSLFREEDILARGHI